MTKLISAGLLMYFIKDYELKLFLVHPGGPFFTKKDEGYWGIPKGLPDKGEDLLNAAKREFEEETGVKPYGEFIELGTVVQKGGKNVYAWSFACKNDDPFEIKCNTFEIEYPFHSGKFQSFPEVDKGGFFTEEEARRKIYPAQAAFIDRLKEHLLRNNLKSNQEKQ